jgi:hypothetical protein
MTSHGTPPAMTIVAARADAIEDCRGQRAVRAACAAITVGAR